MRKPIKTNVWTEYGAPGVPQLKEVEKTFPKDNQVRIRIYATAVKAGDYVEEIERW